LIISEVASARNYNHKIRRESWAATTNMFGSVWYLDSYADRIRDLLRPTPSLMPEFFTESEEEPEEPEVPEDEVPLKPEVPEELTESKEKPEEPEVPENEVPQEFEVPEELEVSEVTEEPDQPEEPHEVPEDEVPREPAGTVPLHCRTPDSLEPDEVHADLPEDAVPM
jgi:hypothetical protein